MVIFNKNDETTLYQSLVHNSISAIQTVRSLKNFLTPLLFATTIFKENKNNTISVTKKLGFKVYTMFLTAK